ncbi:Uu.00g084840.m01.CDS01 [Anthostomella pinea]|uniref:Uu.00g084840.m01.CDS01 n=1 Tax=Anthostomella pinea TaxID=933095 RepID=A0AAI8VGF8_9PEZI|nr:Uu.00g084840.m01.CDS01 [Anthostomella pinea]
MTNRHALPTIESHALILHPQAPENRELELLEPYGLGPKPYNFVWACITLPPPSPDPSAPAAVRSRSTGGVLNTYATSPTSGAYLTLFVALTQGDQPNSPRLTSMRYRDMLAANHVAAGGSLRTLRLIGTASILNRPAREAISQVFRRAGRDWLVRERVEVYPSDLGYAELAAMNPFMRGVLALLRERGQSEMCGAFVERFIFISEGYDAPPGSTGRVPRLEPPLHMVTVFGRPDAAGADDANADNAAGGGAGVGAGSRCGFRMSSART